MNRKKTPEQENALGNYTHLCALYLDYATTVCMPLVRLPKRTGRTRTDRDFNASRRFLHDECAAIDRLVGISEFGAMTEYVDHACERLERRLAPDVKRLFFTLDNAYLKKGIPSDDATAHAWIDTCGAVISIMSSVLDQAQDAMRTRYHIRVKPAHDLRRLLRIIAQLADELPGHDPRPANERSTEAENGVAILCTKLTDVSDNIDLYEPMQVCTVCGATLTLDHFYHRRNGTIFHRCKDCDNKIRRSNRQRQKQAEKRIYQNFLNHKHQNTQP